LIRQIEKVVTTLLDIDQ